MKKPAIGIVGGVGPAAGADLFLKVLRHTRVSCDQDHIDAYMTSCPSIIPDRTGYLLNGGQNPMEGIWECMVKLASLGATAIGVACNTAHSKRIMGQLDYSKLGPDVVVVNMIEETCRCIAKRFPAGVKAGLLATIGTNDTGVYDEYFAMHPGLELVKCSHETRIAVNEAIYSKQYGIKATPAVTEKAKAVILDAAMQLKAAGCEILILGCTELPLALSSSSSPLALIDPTDILAQCLVKATEPDKFI